MAAETFGLEGEFKALVSERDQNFRIITASGDKFVLKIVNCDENPGVVDMQVKALLHIERTDPALKVPHIKFTREGRPYGWVKTDDGSKHILRAVTWIEGEDLGGQEITPALQRKAGSTVARLARALRGFHHPSARHPLLWDVSQIANLRPLTRHIRNKEMRSQVDYAFDDLIANMLPGLERFRHQVIHNDANGDNLVFDASNPDTDLGIIDFGDMIYTVLAADPAITAADLTPLKGDILIPIGEAVAGYDAVYPLEEEEIDLIYDLIMARYTLTAVIIAWRNSRPTGPGYLVLYEEKSYQALDTFLMLGRDKVSRRLREACRFPVYCPKPGRFEQVNTADLLEKRHRYLGKTLELTYENPVHVLRGKGVWLLSAEGRWLLDAYNNVPHVGHANPHVARAVARQAASFNTNTRYLFEATVNYAERLTATMPDGLEACLFVNSGSEANDVAFRIAKMISGNKGAVIMETAYHGITETIDALSPYNYLKRSLPPHVRTLLAPDSYRGPFKAGETMLAEKYAADADRAIDELQKSGYGVAAFMIDSGFTSNGILNAPRNYLKLVAEKIRAAGGLIIADEVQSGFGRMGTHMWGIETHGVVPDMITTGKPIGNGIALGVTVTRPEIRQKFGEQTDFFSTFGGNPVACAAGMAVLDVIEREKLMKHAQTVGDYKRKMIRKLMEKHDLIGDVRGVGLLTGVELVRDRITLEPAASEAKRVVNELRNQGVLVGLEGPHGSILKIRPPLVFKKEHADILVDKLDCVMEIFTS